MVLNINPELNQHGSNNNKIITIHRDIIESINLNNEIIFIALSVYEKWHIVCYFNDKTKLLYGNLISCF